MFELLLACFGFSLFVLHTDAGLPQRLIVLEMAVGRGNVIVMGTGVCNIELSFLSDMFRGLGSLQLFTRKPEIRGSYRKS